MPSLFATSALLASNKAAESLSNMIASSGTVSGPSFRTCLVSSASDGVSSTSLKNEQITQPTFVKCEIDAVGHDRDNLPYLMEDGKIVTEVNKCTKPTFIKNI